MRNAKYFLKSKTLWVSLAAICSGIGLYFSGEQELQELTISVVGAIFAVLRLVTSKPLYK